MLGDTFPDIQPGTWRIRERDNQDRDEANDRWIQINAWEPEVDGALFTVHGEWTVLPKADHRTLIRHWRRNRRKTFALFDFRLDEVLGLYVGTGNGVASRFTLPAKSVVGLALYVNGVLAVPQPALLAGLGADGADDIQFAAAVANGAVLSFDANDARRRYYVIYDGVEIERDRQGVNVYPFVADFVEQPRAVAA